MEELAETRIFKELEGVSRTGRFSVKTASAITNQDWRGWMQALPTDIRNDFESFFLFAEGFVEEVREGFVDGDNDEDLAGKAVSLMNRLRPTES